MAGISWINGGPQAVGLLKSECGIYTVAAEQIAGATHYAAYIRSDGATTMVAMTPQRKEAQHFLELHRSGVLDLKGDGPFPLDFRENPPYLGLKQQTQRIYPAMKQAWTERLQAGKPKQEAVMETAAPARGAQMSLG